MLVIKSKTNMKNKNIFSFIILLSLLFISCSDDPIDDGSGNGNGNTGQNNEYYETNKWIESTMRDYYYWYGEIPKSVNYKNDPESFFMSLLSKKDGKPQTDSRGNVTGHYFYSYMEPSETTSRAVASDSELSLGFEYHYYTIMGNSGTRHALKVLYILPNSPASKGGLRRGDWIFSVNGKSVSADIVESLNDGGRKTLGIANNYTEQVSKELTLSAAIVEDNPVYFSKVYHKEGRKIGYLVYNHFTSGKSDYDETYNNKLRKAFTDFKNDLPDDFILDLRYNRGGAINCAQLLATMLAPSNALGDVFCNVVYNDKKSSNNYSYKFDSKYMTQGGDGANLNPKRLFVITSESTASASEAVINGLLPFMSNKLILAGERTEGKNVGSIVLTDSKYDWKLHPIVCLVSNKNKESDYEDGFIPTVDYELSDVHEGIYDLGDENEYMLNRILRNILYNEKVSISNLKSASSDASRLTLIGSSLDRKATNGILLPQ